MIRDLAALTQRRASGSVIRGAVFEVAGGNLRGGSCAAAGKELRRRPHEVGSPSSPWRLQRRHHRSGGAALHQLVGQPATVAQRTVASAPTGGARGRVSAPPHAGGPLCLGTQRRVIAASRGMAPCAADHFSEAPGPKAMRKARAIRLPPLQCAGVDRPAIAVGQAGRPTLLGENAGRAGSCIKGGDGLVQLTQRSSVGARTSK